MSSEFLKGVSGKLAEQWVGTILTPAFIFWAGGAAIALQHYGWQTLSAQFSAYPEPLQITLLIVGFCIIAASGFVVQRFDLSVLRFLEGYWPTQLRPLRRWLVRRAMKYHQRVLDRWQPLAHLANTAPAQLTAEQQEEFIQLDRQQLQMPLPNQTMPTRLGNILRAAERRPLEKYGLDAIVCWPHLWLILPDAVKTDLQATRADLDSAVRIWLWSLLFLIWGIWAWWAIPLGLGTAFFAYDRWALDAARAYATLIEAVFDIHRFALYRALHFPLPNTPDAERVLASKVNTYLQRGTFPPGFQYDVIDLMKT